MIDYCFQQIADIISKMNEVQERYYPVLFESTLDAANLLLTTCELAGQKPTTSFINKMFKLSDGYLVNHNKSAKEENQLPRSYINHSFDTFRKKKEAAAAKVGAAAPAQIAA